MNSRERILVSIRHKEPDRVPVDLGATTSSGISAIAYNNLKKHLGISQGETRIYDVVQQLAQPEELILDRFNIDAVDIGRMYNLSSSDWYEVTLADGSTGDYPKWFNPIKEDNGSFKVYTDDGTLIATMASGTTYFDQTCYPYQDGFPVDLSNLDDAMDKVLWKALGHSPWDHMDHPNFWQTLREKSLYLREHSDRAIIIGCGCNTLEWGNYLRRMDNFLMDIYTEPKVVERFLDALMEKHMATLEKVCEHVGDVVDIIRFCDDLGMDQAPFMSPEIYRKIFKPRHKMLCDYVKKHSQMHTYIHSCGSIYKLMPDMIDAGIEIFNPIQTTANDMDVATLKREFGKDITFWGGGCETRNILNRGTPEEVKEYVKRQLDIFMPGGGFVFNQEHNIMPDVPPENIVAMYEAVDEFSK